MATYVLIHGAGSTSWYWHRVVPELQALNHDVVAVDLPSDDDAAGIDEYVETTICAIGDRRDLVVVGQSLAGFTAPVVCGSLPVVLLVLINAMVPRPGEPAGEWWSNTGHVFPEPFDPEIHFLHDVLPDVAAEAAHHLRRQSDTVFRQPWPLPRWPEVPTRYLLCRDDRFFPADFQRRMVLDRLGTEPDEMEGGHLPALSRPTELVLRLEQLRLSVEYCPR
jgi:pimeloyl-ACP methyl ester carboxylesterase